MADARLIPPAFARTTTNLYGARGAAWLAHLPAFLAELEQRWSIRILPPFALSYNYVAPAIRADGSEVVLKVGVPNQELTSEVVALGHFAGRGMVNLLDSDVAAGAMLLERLLPGETLHTLPDEDEATRAAAVLLLDLWVPAPPDPGRLLCRLENWANGGMQRLRQTFDGGTGPFSARLVDRVEGLYRELLSEPEPWALMHGDFHHYNILSAQRRGWLALDPKGLIGPRAYEVVPFLYNRWPENPTPEALGRLALRRLSIFQEVLGLDMRMMLAWAAGGCFLSAWWTYEENQQIDVPMLSFTERLLALLEPRLAA